MAWIESHQELANHPKTKKLMRLLSLPLPTVIGHLHLLWWWAMDYAESGDLSKYDAGDIEDACHWTGNEGELLNALIKSNFIDERAGSLVLHDWYDFVGRLLDKREQNKERKRKSRARHAPVTQESQEVASDDGDSHRATVPNQTKPYLNKDILSSANKDEGKEKSEESQKPESFYLAHKRVFGFECNPLQSQKLSAYIDNDGMDEAVVVRAIERAAEKGTSYRFGFITRILNDYADAGAKTVEAAVALDNEFSRRLSDEKYERSASSLKHRGNQTTGHDYEGPNSFEQQYPGVIVKL